MPQIRTLTLDWNYTPDEDVGENSIKVAITTSIHPAEPDVGISGRYAEIENYSCKTPLPPDWLARIIETYNDEICERALEEAEFAD